MPTTKHSKKFTDSSQNIRVYTPLLPNIRYSLVDDGLPTYLSDIEYSILSSVLTDLRQGNSITLVPSEAYMTTQEAADVLNVSRPYFVKLLENGEIPFSKVGNRRRVLVKDVLSYKTQRDTERRQTLEEFSAGIYEDGLDDLDYGSVCEMLKDD
ncbi:helix-turn-helix domain-containing protein [Chroococcus sp. FPU101]|uniref:helix-turn-helix domain-containing protein n=1 Tax=Chroococcus sp. FPU101 TaxID=1974212 RepID=UPI001A8C8646|nr:helix-turn-helix domain-containing protein [Chroococcus sp. FPU101]